MMFPETLRMQLANAEKQRDEARNQLAEAQAAQQRTHAAAPELLNACKLALRFALVVGRFMTDNPRIQMAFDSSRYGDHLSENEIGNLASQLADAIAKAKHLKEIEGK